MDDIPTYIRQWRRNRNAEGAFAPPPPHFSEGGQPMQNVPPMFLTWDILSGVKMPQVSQIFKIKWFRWP